MTPSTPRFLAYPSPEGRVPPKAAGGAILIGD